MFNKINFWQYPSFCLLCLLVPIVWLYYPVITFDFVWDDGILFDVSPLFYSKQSSILSDPAFLKALLSEKFLDVYYRPFPLFFYLFWLELSDQQAWLPHLANLILYLLTIVLVFKILIKMLLIFYDTDVSLQKMVPIASLVSVLFALNPQHVEPVAWISGTFEMWFVFLLVAILYVDLVKEKNIYVVVGLFFLFLLALLSKETAVIFLAVYPIWRLLIESRHNDFAFTQLFQKANIVVFSGFVFTFFLYLIIRYTFTGDWFLFSGQGHELNLGREAWLVLFLKSFLQHITGLILPASTVVFQRTVAVDDLTFTGSFESIPAVLLIVLLLLVLVYLLMRHKRVFLLAVLVLVSLVPTINLVPNPYNLGLYFANRFLYLPTVFLALFEAWLLVLAKKRLWLKCHYYFFWAVLIIFIMSCVTTNIKAIGHWKNDTTLFEWGVQSNPTDPSLIHISVKQWMDRGKMPQALALCNRFLPLYPKNTYIVLSCAELMMQINQAQQAQMIINRSLSLVQPGDVYTVELHNFLAKYYLSQGEVEAALIQADQMLKILPNSQAAYFHIVLSSLLKQDCDQAAIGMINLIKRYPDYVGLKKKWLQQGGGVQWDLFTELLNTQVVSDVLAQAVKTCVQAHSQ